jgi:hypothetical protein
MSSGKISIQTRDHGLIYDCDVHVVVGGFPYRVAREPGNAREGTKNTVIFAL